MNETANKLWYRRPAAQWLEALPIGNGRLAAMIYGGAPKETFQLNEGTIWAGKPHNYEHPGALDALPEIRRLVFAREWQKAQDLVTERFLSQPVRQMPYQNAGYLDLDFGDSDPITGYRRELDIDEAVARVSYAVNGIHFTREAFASNPDSVIVVRLTSDEPGALSFSATLRSPRGPACVATQKALVLNDRAGHIGQQPGATRYRIETRILATGGATTAGDDKVSVKNADEAILLLAIGTSYVRFDDADGDENAIATRALDAASEKSFAQLKAAHIADYQILSRRFSITLGGSEAADRPTDERIQTQAVDKDPALAALYCQYGRYLLISSSRTGGLPATLQGLWNDSLTPPWDSKFTINVNTEMNYWPAGPANLIECYDPLLAHLESMAISGARTAKTHYGANGWVAHHNTDAWAGSAPVDSAFHGMWQTGGAWLCKCVWDRYEYTGDVDTLRKNYPVLRGAAQFFLDTLIEEPSHGWLVTNPSNSPENAHHPGVSICAGPTMDIQIIRDLFHNCAEAARLLDTDATFRNTLISTAAKLPPMQIGKEGQLQEWLEDWDGQVPEPLHRHTSHLYGLHPGRQITPKQPDLFAGARRTLELRGDESTGWSMAWRVNLWARLRDGDHSHKLLSSLLTPARTAPNLFDLHPPFQIDGNFGGAAGIVEMLIQSHDGQIELLPALPAAWPAGAVSGVLARGGFTLSIRWQDGRLAGGTIASPKGGACRLSYDDREVSVILNAGEVRQFDGALTFG